jgi:acyl carrier protein
MLARLSDRDRELLDARGLEALKPAQALAGLGSAMLSGTSHRMIARIRWERLREATRATPVPLLQRLMGGTPDRPAASAAPAAATPAFDVAEWAALAPEERAERLDEYLVSALAAVLRLRPDRVSPTTSIAHLGFDSLMAMELRNRIEADLGILVPVAGMLGSGTPAELARLVAELLEAPPPAAVAAPVEAAATIETFDF